MAQNGLSCAHVPLRIYSLTLTMGRSQGRGGWPRKNLVALKHMI